MSVVTPLRFSRGALNGSLGGESLADVAQASSFCNCESVLRAYRSLHVQCRLSLHAFEPHGEMQYSLFRVIRGYALEREDRDGYYFELSKPNV